MEVLPCLYSLRRCVDAVTGVTEKRPRDRRLRNELCAPQGRKQEISIGLMRCRAWASDALLRPVARHGAQAGTPRCTSTLQRRASQTRRATTTWRLTRCASARCRCAGGVLGRPPVGSWRHVGKRTGGARAHCTPCCQLQTSWQRLCRRGRGCGASLQQQTEPAHLLCSRASKRLRACTLVLRAILASDHHRHRSRTLRRPPRSARQVCNARDQCYTCWPRTGCAPLKEYNRLVVREHGRLHGAAAMKAEVRAPGRTRSPVLLSIAWRRAGARLCGGGRDRWPSDAQVVVFSSLLRDHEITQKSPRPTHCVGWRQVSRRRAPSSASVWQA